VPHLQLEGKADRYQHFLASTANSNLVAVSDDFHFRIQSIEGPSLLIRHVSTHGQVSNYSELTNAFFALILSYHPGGFSCTDPLSDSAPHPPGPTLHWHLANRSCINHHHNSKVTYLRLESTALLRELSAQAITASQLAGLQGVPASTHLVQLIEDLSLELANTDIQQQPPLTEAFFNRLGQELRLLLGPPSASNTNAAGHVSLAIEWMLSRLSEPINLQQLADEMGLTPRSVQGCFKSVLAISPIRWLKLARISKLRQLLWCGDLTQFSIQQLMSRCGLSDTSPNRQLYRDVYGVSPREERRQAENKKRQYGTAKNDSQCYQFDSTKAAVQYQERLNNLKSSITQNCRVSIVISSSTKEINDDWWPFQT
jgi:AraC-like DNA-binding protein